MILVAIEIENYKQYAGNSRIEFPREGIVAITGANGAGKTTLFEAIEWCLYCPKSIAQASIPPHEGIGKTVVRLTLEDEHDGKQYTVVRELRSSGTRAEIYAEHEPWQPLVQGTREVTQYVARKLVGLPHGAFVSTFFTKQRELQMFGDLRPTDRRVEVAKLLGLEAVREAQNQIGEGRTAARALAEARRAEHERRIAGRNLEQEAGDAAANVHRAERLELEATTQFALASEAASVARTQLDGQRELQERDAEIQRRSAVEAALLARAKATFDASDRELARLDLRTNDRVQLLKLVEHLSQHERDVARHELERSRAERATHLQQQVLQSQDLSERVANRLRTILDDNRADAAGLLIWNWGGFETADSVLVSEKVCRAISELDVRSLQARLEAMQNASQQHLAIVDIDQKLHRYRDFLTRLQQERDAMSASGDPEARVAEAVHLVQEAREAEQRGRLERDKSRDETDATRQLVQTLRQHQDAAVCPTCARPLSTDDFGRLVATLSARLLELESAIERLTAAVSVAEKQVTAAIANEHDARSVAEKLHGLNGRIQDGERHVSDAELQSAEATTTLDQILSQLGISETPTTQDIEKARTTLERARRIAGIAGSVQDLGDRARDANSAERDALAQLNELSEVYFDDAAMRIDLEKLQGARRAAAQVEQIDVELALRGSYELDRSESDREIARIMAVQTALNTERDEVGFDSAMLAMAQSADQAARETADALRESALHARHQAQEAQRARERISQEIESIRQLLKEADAHAREADELTRMYEEFREFDRYVARQVGPLLAESTERMLGHVTNGKFDQVQFDENYGIEIFDGDQPFPMASFSGGERDVVALCARLALSEIVGLAALRPPRFLVLDEVFGSLDSERRAQLLEMLGGLANSGYFRQMFIISHIDDVQQSPVMTEAWRIEDSDGVSRVVRPNAMVA